MTANMIRIPRTESLLALLVLPLVTLSAQAAAAEPQATESVNASDVIAGYESRWISALALGVQFLPDYNDEGKSTGLNKQKFFGLVTVDGRFGDEATAGGWRLPFADDFHTGVTLTMLGTAVARNAEAGAIPDDFDDVANSIFASTYLYAPTFRTTNRVHNLGPIARVGAISRDSVARNDDGSNGDSVNWMYSLGAQYTYESFQLATNSDKKRPINGIPAGYFRFSAARFEDYAGLGDKWRWVADAAFQVYPAKNVYFGVQGNFGKGPDEFMIVASFVRKPEEIATLFNLGKDDEKDKQGTNPAPAPAGG